MNNLKALGGKRKGAEKKPKPLEERRIHVFSLKFTREEKLLLEKSKARIWARNELLEIARECWKNSHCFFVSRTLSFRLFKLQPV